MRTWPRLAAGGLLLALAVLGCGEDSETGRRQASRPAPSTSVPRPPVASAPDAKPPPPDASAPRPESPQGAEHEGGGERPVRVPAAFTVRPGGLRPRSISVPAFLTVEVTVVSADGRAHRIAVHADRVYRLSVPAGGSDTVRMAGQRAGEYAVGVDGRRAAVLVVGGEPGP